MVLDYTTLVWLYDVTVTSLLGWVESFLGFANYHREFVKRYAEVANPLYALTGPKVKFSWSTRAEDAFNNLKDALMDAPVLPYPDPKHTFILDCDASDTAVAGELGQVVDGKVQVIGYGSFTMTPEQQSYCTTRKELLAVVRMTRQYRHYLLGRPFLVRTDLNSLTWLMRFKNIQGQLARWLEELSEYDMSIVLRPGKKHINADSLSRIPDTLPGCDCYRAGSIPKKLPCGGCTYCFRAHSQWARFEEEVDDVIPLALRGIPQPGTLLDPAIRALCLGVEEGLEAASTCFEGFTKAELRSKQLEDPDTKAVIGWLEDGTVPSQASLALSGPSAKYL